MKKQTGSIYRRGDCFVLRYRETINIGGKLETKQRAKQLCLVDATHKTVRAIWKDENLTAEIDRILKPINNHKQPETVVTLGGFVTDVYLPFVDAHKRKSTAKGYRDMWQDHVSRVAGDVLLRNVRTVDVQGWLRW
jgi:hypothetical protein